MPRPNPPKTIATGRPYAFNYEIEQTLTPRTPHSRHGAGRGNEYEYEYEQGLESGRESWYRPTVVDEEFHGHGHDFQQREPLLKSSTDNSFPNRIEPMNFVDRGRRKKKFGFDARTLLSRVPLFIGVTLAFVLFFLIVISLKRPDILKNAIGEEDFPVSDGGEEVLSKEPQLTETKPPSNHPILSYENYTSFPLSPTQFRSECFKWQASMKGHSTFWHIPPGGALDVTHKDEKTSKTHTHLPEMEEKKICSSSITYMLDGHVGLAADLALMAQTAGLAREQNRTFFVNDQYWNRGKWLDHFQDVRYRQPGPEPGCFEPPPEELVACPRVARHWVVNSRTALFHFGHPFSEEFEDPYARSLRRLKPIYERARVSFEEVIRPNAENAALIRAARKEIEVANANIKAKTKTTQPSAIEKSNESSDPGSYIAIHIRRGDRKAEAWPNRDHYVPLGDFVSAASEAWSRLGSQSRRNGVIIDKDFSSPPPVWLASDDPLVLSNVSAQLEDTFSPHRPSILGLERSSNERLKTLASTKAYVQSEFNELGLKERVDATRGALVDLALLSGLWAWEDEAVPLASICTISSNICKITAIGLGWERAFGFNLTEDAVKSPFQVQDSIDDKRKRWIDVDDRGTIEPEWRAFEMF